MGFREGFGTASGCFVGAAAVLIGVPIAMCGGCLIIGALVPSPPTVIETTSPQRPTPKSSQDVIPLPAAVVDNPAAPLPADTRPASTKPAEKKIASSVPSAAVSPKAPAAPVASTYLPDGIDSPGRSAATLPGASRAIRILTAIEEERERRLSLVPDAEKRFRSRRASNMTQQLESLAKEVAELNDPTFLPFPKMGRPLHVGDIGEFVGAIKVFQVVSKDSMLVERDDDERFLITNWTTSTTVDGKSYKFPGVFEVTGTQRYTTVLGATRQVMVAEPVEFSGLEVFRELVPARVTPEKPKPGVPIKSADEVAAARLKTAKKWLETSPDLGRKVLREIVEKHPDSDAAKEAAELLKGL